MSQGALTTVELGGGEVNALAAASRAAPIPALLAILAMAGMADDGHSTAADFSRQTSQGTVTVAGGWEVTVIVGDAPLAGALIDLQVKQTGFA